MRDETAFVDAAMLTLVRLTRKAVADDSGSAAARKVRPRIDEYHALHDADLIAAMRREEHYAFVEFIERFRMIAWNQARDLGVASDERKSWTEEVLHDCALALVREGARIPGNLAGYVVVSVRRKFFKQYHKAREERKVTDDIAHEMSSVTNQGAAEEEQQLPNAVIRLVDEIVATLSEEEELLLVWKGHRITYGTIADWLGESRNTVAQRVWRLTKRLSRVTEQILATFSSADRDVVRRFLDGEEEK